VANEETVELYLCLSCTLSFLHIKYRIFLLKHFIGEFILRNFFFGGISVATQTLPQTGNTLLAVTVFMGW
jgi:hypothetical protein